MGVRKKNFSKKKFFFRNFSASFSTCIVDTRGLRRQPKRGGPSSYRFELWGAKNFRQKNSNPRIGKSGRQISIEFSKTIAFTPAIRSGRRKDFVFADFEKFAPKICDMNPHSIFAFWGCPRSQNKMTQTQFGAACSSEINTFYRVRFISTPSRDINFFGYCLHFGLGGFRRVRSRVNP
jgi:hypothetical protein